jgi:hypothetical protein
VYERLQEFVEICEDRVCTSAVVFVAHQEEQCRTSNSNAYMRSSSRLGTSNFFYCARTRSILRSPTTREEEVYSAKGVVVAANRSASLLSVIRCCHQATAQLEVRARATLVVVPRGAFAQTSLSLPGAATAATPRELDDLSESAELVVVVADLLTERRERLAGRSTQFERCFLVGWPAVSAERVWRALAERPPGLFLIGLALWKELRGECPLYSGIRTTPLTGELETFFGIPETHLTDPDSLHGLLSVRFHQINDAGPLRTSPPTPRYEEIGEAEAPAQPLAKALACTRGPFAWVAGAGEPVARFFRSRAANETTFGVSSYEGPAESTCPVCLDRNSDTVLCCGHWFCEECLVIICENRSPRCPVCKHITDPREDVVATRRPAPSAEHERLLLALTDQLSEPARKVLILSSFGAQHERFARSCRKRHLNVVSWSGSGRQLEQNLSVFQSSERCALLVDASHMSLRWCSLAPVDRLIVLAPLVRRRGAEGGCQLQEALDVCCPAEIVYLHWGESWKIYLPPPQCAACL